jgi:nucleoside-diphosphate-sugar epimerase
VAVALRVLRHCTSPPLVLNLAGPETASVRKLAERLGDLLDREPVFAGSEELTALLSDARRCFGLFGYPGVTLDEMLVWTAVWLRQGGRLLDRPTHFAERAGQF